MKIKINVTDKEDDESSETENRSKKAGNQEYVSKHIHEEKLNRLLSWGVFLKIKCLLDWGE